MAESETIDAQEVLPNEPQWIFDGSVLQHERVRYTNDVVAALKTPDGIVVAWPSTLDDKGLVDKITAALADQRDFFDRKKILAVGGGAGKGELYTLILLERGGETTLEGPDTSPWRLEVWRWSGDAEEGKFALAGRGCLFRGIGATDVKPPPVTLDVGVVAVE